jgi:hypothetical protein
MEAHINYYEQGNEMTAFLDGIKVARCYETGLIAYRNEKGREKSDYLPKFEGEKERLQLFRIYCEQKFGSNFEIKTYYRYNIKFNDGVVLSLYAQTDEDAIKERESYLNPNPATITRGDRIIAENITRKPIEFYTARKTWKYRDRINPRGKFYL